MQSITLIRGGARAIPSSRQSPVNCEKRLMASFIHTGARGEQGARVGFSAVGVYVYMVVIIYIGGLRWGSEDV